MPVGVAQPGVEFARLPACGDSPAYPLFIGLLLDEALAFSRHPGLASQGLTPASDAEARD